MFGNAENRQSRSGVGGEEAGRCEDIVFVNISDSDVNMKTEPVKTDMMSTVLSSLHTEDVKRLLLEMKLLPARSIYSKDSK